MARLEHERITQELMRLEPKAMVYTVAMMAFNPSIGRALPKGSVGKFVEVAETYAKSLVSITTQRQFDNWHNRFVRKLVEELRRLKGGVMPSYGQGQKPVNVFLKLFVHWGGKPDGRTAKRVRGWLHVPLDSRVMGYIRGRFGEMWDEELGELYRDRGTRPSDTRLSRIDQEMYEGWQDLLRRICPRRPILLDTIWAAQRFRLGFSND
ncbi:MAG: hypothetical protein ACE5R4_15245 [Armatimonadota bacterium]